MGRREADEKLNVSDTDLLSDGFIVLRSGKNNYHIDHVAA